MRQRQFSLWLGLSLALASPLNDSACAADTVKGRKLALDMCAKCHNVEAGVVAKQRPHSFQAIANYYETDDVRARILAPSMHLGMPDIGWALTWNDIDDLTAYIMSLEAPETKPGLQ